MFQDTQPAPLHDGPGPDAWQAFRVDDPREVERLLRQLREDAVPVHLSTPCGQHAATTLWTFDGAGRRLSFSADQRLPQMQTIVERDEATAVAYLESVKLQFELHDLMLVHGARSSALQAAWPQPLYRFQRRDAYRVRTPERTPATASLRHPAIPEMRLALRIVDVSIGGCALALPADVPPLQPGSVLNEVRIELDADTRFVATLQLQHLTSLQPGDSPARLGCCWVRLDGTAQRVLQRYIDQLQKRRRLLSLGRA